MGDIVTEYILTERCTGDYTGHLTILETSQSEKAIKRKKESIIRARLSKPLFSEKWTRETLDKDLEIWQKIS